jgi:aldose 1-epimerase
VDLYTLRNQNGVEVRITNFGGVLVSLKVPDKSGKFDDVLLGHNDFTPFLTDRAHFGALIGRYGNRIAKGKFSLNGKTYTLATNNGENHLHGGVKGFDKDLWTGKAVESADGPAVQLNYLSKDGEENYPGNLSVTAVYTLMADNALRLDFTATTDQPTVCNLTHHPYFNLRGQGNVLDYVVQINAEKFTPCNDKQIPTGELRSVAGTPFDFRKPAALGARINDNDGQLRIANGYDMNFVLDKPPGQLGLAARVVDQVSGRCLELSTTEPGLQFYSSNGLKAITGKGGRVYQPHDAFCMEPQHFPDSPNHPNFPSTELKPGQTYRNSIVYKFSVA